MPQIYSRNEPRTRTLSSASSASTSTSLEPINADDSIVLSDLIRSGEASRLRRRGAMRIDHGTSCSWNGRAGIPISTSTCPLNQTCISAAQPLCATRGGASAQGAMDRTRQVRWLNRRRTPPERCTRSYVARRRQLRVAQMNSSRLSPPCCRCTHHRKRRRRKTLRSGARGAAQSCTRAPPRARGSAYGRRAAQRPSPLWLWTPATLTRARLPRWCAVNAAVSTKASAVLFGTFLISYCSCGI
jgi:hypothetical protein